MSIKDKNKPKKPTKPEDIAISVRNVSKSFKLPHEKQNSVKGMFINMFRGKKIYEKQQVLEDITFDIKKGEFFGIVGRNGSGKSTLLKLISQIYTPDKGSITVNGKLTPFIELGVGFNPELTGRENVFLNGALLGFSREEMRVMYDEIVEFAELERFMDQKLKNYSSGMQVRLAFSIAIRAETDILVLDEVLAVGDYNFQQKCYEYFRHLKKIKQTVILVSHDSGAIQNFCDRAVLIEKGDLKAQGNPQKVIKEYAEQNRDDQVEAVKKDKSKIERKVEPGNGAVSFLSMYTTSEHKKTQVFSPRQEIVLHIRLRFNESIDDPVFGIIIQDTTGGMPVFATNTLDANIKTRKFKKGELIEAKFLIRNDFNDSKYTISGAVASSDRAVLYVRYLNAHEFRSTGWTNTAKAIVYSDYSFDIIKSKDNDDKQVNR